VKKKDGFDHTRGLWFASLPERHQEEVLRHAVPLKFRRGKHLFPQGDPPTGIFGIISGEVQVIGNTLAGLDILMSVQRPGNWTGFLACLDGRNFTFNVVASQPCEVLHLPIAAVRRIFMHDVDALSYMVAPELGTLRALYSHLIEQIASTPLQRTARRLVHLASNTQGEQVTARTLSPITQDQLALSIMSSRQWTNRLLQHLEKTGLIARSCSRIDVLDLPRRTHLAIEYQPALTPTHEPSLADQWT